MVKMMEKISIKFSILLVPLFVLIGLSSVSCIPLEPPRNAESKGIQRGDILFHPDFFSNDPEKGGWVGSRWRWPGGVVVYYIDPAFTTNERNVIGQAMYEIESKTCVRFREYNGDADYVYIQRNAGGCWSWYGRQGGSQLLSLDSPNCVYQGTVAHELIHAIGFVHEQARPDRDDWVYIDWSNIQPGQESNFEKYSTSQVETYGVPYDYSSIMHYRRREFAWDPNRDVITPVYSWAEICGPCEVRESDATKINRMYEGIC